MTHKQLIIPGHAAQRMAERGITKLDVRWLLARGIHSLEETWGGTQRHGKRGMVGHREAMVVYIETATTIELITAEWTDEKPER